MNKQKIGIVHPGNMGISIAASAQNAGNTVYWASESRSEETRVRAEKHGLVDAGSLANLCDTCETIISVCPPHAAEEVAGQVFATGFRGLYIDANAISPQRAERIGEAVTEAGAMLVDGGIIDGPAWQPGTTWLHLSGKKADEAATLFSAGPLETNVLGDEIGKASALKMCYAAFTKGSTALLCAILAAADAMDVRAALAEQWSQGGSDFAAKTDERVVRVTAKAWRFAGEMDEIAATLDAAGVPGEFHTAAADIYQRLAHFKGAPTPPSLEKVLAALLNN
jgi:3-hydroxyisobutyrate dehydrogenase-like beta-hydroxyacid dehydrogenase